MQEMKLYIALVIQLSLRHTAYHDIEDIRQIGENKMPFEGKVEDRGTNSEGHMAS